MGNLETPVRFAQGSRIGPYSLVHFLGRGGFGEVWLGERAGGIVTTRLALKLPLDHKIDLAAIRQEADLWVRGGNHPNVLPLFEADVYNGQIVLVSEYARDGSLSTWLERHGGRAASLGTAIEMALGILAGLHHLHTRGIIHRDLKPANVLMQSECPRLADFGIARLLAADAQTNRAAGTPAYMAPEAFDGQRSVQTDVWSAGVILFRLLAGCLPFAEGDVMSLMRAISSKEPTTLSAAIPRPVQDTVARSLRKDPAQRYSTANQMRQALQEAFRQIEPARLFSTWGVDRANSQVQGGAPQLDHPTVGAGDSPPHNVEPRPADTPPVVPVARHFRAFVEIASGPTQGKEYELLKDRVVIGRSPDCDIHVTSLAVSRYHAQFVRTDNGYSFEDLRTSNGSYVNGHLVKERIPLRCGDRIHTGPTILVYRSEGGTSA
jgi:serine/threonine-protein kinase